MPPSEKKPKEKKKRVRPPKPPPVGVTGKRPGESLSSKPADIMSAALIAQDQKLIDLSREIGEEADRQLLELIKRGVPVGCTDFNPQTAAYVSALSLGLKRANKLTSEAASVRATMSDGKMEVVVRYVTDKHADADD